MKQYHRREDCQTVNRGESFSDLKPPLSCRETCNLGSFDGPDRAVLPSIMKRKGKNRQLDILKRVMAKSTVLIILSTLEWLPVY